MSGTWHTLNDELCGRVVVSLQNRKVAMRSVGVGREVESSFLAAVVSVIADKDRR